MPTCRRWILSLLLPCVVVFNTATNAQVIGVPEPVSPPDQSTDVPLTLVFQWSSVPLATGYDLQASTSASFSSILINESAIGGTSIQETVPDNATRYYWRVRATSVLIVGDWSAAWTFTTVALPPPVPALLSPPDGATDIPSTVTLMWQASTPGSLYRIQVARDTAFATIVRDQNNISGTTYDAASLSSDIKYFWRVMAKESGQLSSWSDIWRFTTAEDAPAAPVLLTPPNGAYDQPAIFTVRWNQSAGASTYVLQVSADPGFSSPEVDTSLSQESCQIGPLGFNTTYYWRVIATNNGGTSAWSEVWSFATQPASTSGPALVSPPNNSSNQSTSPLLSWQALSGSSQYHLQVSIDPSFGQLTVDDSSITNSSRALASLQNNTTYYWRVRGRFIASYSNWSGVWAFTTIPLPPNAPSLASPSNGATNVAASPMLTWNPAAGATKYRLQVSPSAAFGTMVEDDSTLTATSKQITLAANTTFYWRVNASNSGGTSNWSGVWSFTTQPASTVGPTLLSPQNNAVNQSTSPVLSWQALPGASQYHVQVSSDPSFGQRTVDDSSITTTSRALASLQNNATYYWRVRGKFIASYSNWSGVWDFTTVPLPPNAPSLASPANYATNVAASPVLTWNAAAGATKYRLQVSTSPAFGALVEDDSILTATSKQVAALAANTTFYWRVNASNSGGTSNWSGVWNFATQPASTTGPALLSPQNSAVNQSTSPVVSWQTLSGASQYHLQVSIDPSFGQRTVDDSSITTTSRALTSLQNNATYYWRVRGRFIASYSDWSAVWDFTTIPLPPNAPSLASPSNNATNVATSPVLTWNGAAGATKYRLQVSTSGSFGSLVADDSTLTVTTKQLGVLPGNATFYWRVNASNPGGTSAWSAVWHFTTIPAVPASPSLVSPADGAADQPVSLNFSWNPVQGASWYHVQISLNPGFTLLESDRDSIAGTSLSASGLSRGSIHYWRVNASNAGGTGAWSLIRSFTTVPDPPAPPVLSAPIDHATDRPTTLVLAWDASAGTASYRVQLSNDSTFGVRTVDDSNVVGTSKQVQGLAYNTPYAWRVRGKNSGGTGNWSQTGHFSTQQSGTQSGPNLASPPDGSVNMPRTVLLSWNALVGATAYELQVSDRSDFSATVYDNSTLTSTSQSVGSLSNSTRYFWRVRGAVVAVWSDWSTVWTFSIIPAVPSAPSLATPADGASDQPRNATLGWNAIPGATQYHLQCSANPQFNALAENDSTLTAASTVVGPLALNTDYYWRVRAKNDGGWGPFSASRSFKTTTGAGAPVVSTDQATGVTANSAMMHATINPNGLSTTVTFQYGTTVSYGSSINGTPPTVTGSAPVGVSAALTGLTPGAMYHYRVVASSTAGVANGNDQVIVTQSATYASTVDLTALVSFPARPNPSDYTPADYLLVGLPGAGNLGMSTFMTGTRGTDWQMYWDNGAAGGGIVQYDGGPDFTALPGRAFWLINRGAWSVQTSLASAPLDSQRTSTISLHAGWNLITNPFTTPRSWGSIQQLNSVTEPLHAFRAGFSVTDTLNPYEGYYFFNATGLTGLKIPYDVQIIAQGKAGGAIERGWTLRIDVESKDGRDLGSEIGVSEEEGDDTSLRRYHKPRGFGTMPQAYFSRPEWDPVYSYFSTDIRGSVQAAENWAMDVSAPAGRPVTLTFSGVEKIPPRYNVLLIDELDGRVVDVRKSSTHSFTPRTALTHLTIFVGTDEATGARLVSVRKPQSFSLGRNFPNPFNPSTTIPVEIPARAFVELKVYNILGKEIRTLFSGELDQGNTAFVWDGRDRGGSVVPSGMYVCRLTTSSGVSVSRKMMLSK